MSDAKLQAVEEHIRDALKQGQEIKQILDGVVASSVQLSGNERSSSISKLAAALSRAQSKVKGAKKDGWNPHFERKYSSLGDCWDACREAVTENELAVIQLPCGDNGQLALMTYLLHSSGEFIGSRLPLPLPQGRSDPQAIGSAITYGRRYGLCAMVGISPEDDDGEGSMPRQGQPAKATTAKKQAAKPPAAAPYESYMGTVQAVLVVGDEVCVMFPDRVCVAGPGNPSVQKALMNTENKRMSLVVAATERKSKTGLPVYAVMSAFEVKDGAGAS